jgi:hypothetical protein
MNPADSNPAVCLVCGDELLPVDDCDAGEIGALTSRLSEAPFSCEECSSVFHGRCGGAQSVAQSPGFAALICPHCGRKSEQEFPFQIRPYQA